MCVVRTTRIRVTFHWHLPCRTKHTHTQNTDTGRGKTLTDAQNTEKTQEQHRNALSTTRLGGDNGVFGQTFTHYKTDGENTPHII